MEEVGQGGDTRKGVLSNLSGIPLGTLTELLDVKTDEYGDKVDIVPFGQWSGRPSPAGFVEQNEGGVLQPVLWIRRDTFSGLAKIGDNERVDGNTLLDKKATENLRKEVAFWNSVLSESLPIPLPHPTDDKIVEELRWACKRSGLSGPQKVHVVDTLNEIPELHVHQTRNPLAKFDDYIGKLIAPLKGKGLTFTNRRTFQYALNEVERNNEDLPAWRSVNTFTASTQLWKIQALVLLPFVPHKNSNQHYEEYTKLKQFFRSVYCWYRLDPSLFQPRHHTSTHEQCPVDEITDWVIRWPISVRRDEQSRLHCATGPSVIFRNKKKHYFLRGIECTEDEVMRPNPELILYEENVQKRAVLIEHVGAKAFLKANRAHMVHQDELGQKLWIIYLDTERRYDAYLRQRLRRTEDIQIVEVINSTPEPDDNGVMVNKHYYLFVPPHVRRVDEAIAWTFGLNAGEYNPEKET